MGVDSEIVTGLKEQFKDEAAKIISFLEKGFPDLDAQYIISFIFLLAKEGGVTVDRVLEELEKEWKDNWKSQPPEFRGVPFTSQGAVISNITSYKNVFLALDLCRS